MKEFLSELLAEFVLPLHNPILVFSVILLIILLSPILLQRFKIPGIIGLIISGIIIGPYGFHIIESADNNSAVELFSTIGLLYIMFVAGLELNLAQFKMNKYKSLSFGILTFIFPLAIGYGLCHYILGYDFNASLLTASMFATHTLVAYPIVSKLGVTKNEAVAITVGGTIFTDTAVLLILAVIVGNAQGNLSQDFFIRLGISFVLFLIIMFFIVPKIARWFFSKLESEKHAHFIFSLAVLFFAAFLADISGLEPIIGAFIAGLALNPIIPKTSALMNRIEFSGNALFIPFFLISVGMIVDVSVVIQGWGAAAVAGILIVGAVLGKWIAAFLTQVFFKYSKTQRNLIFGLSSSHAAATLAVILVGYRLEILDDNILNGTIILILVSCIIASFATERAAKTLALTDDDTPSSEKTLNKFAEHILIPVANLASVPKLLEFAVLIKNLKSTKPLSLLSIIKNDSNAELNLLKTKDKLEEYVQYGAAAEIEVNTITTIDYNVVEGISRMAKEVMVDILILGWPGKAGIINKIAGERVNNIVYSVNKNIFVTSIENAFVENKRIILVTPKLANKEKGFKLWTEKVFKLASELSAGILHFGTEEVDKSLKNLAKKNKFNVKIEFHEFTEWEDFLILARYIEDDDLFIIVSARRNSFSYVAYFENIFAKIERYYSDYNRIVIFPQQIDSSISQFEDLANNPLTKGIEAIENIGKGIGKIFIKPDITHDNDED
ncbi:MAG: cation:proton antiporter [Bacteroidales bacterium]|nr:cation:proton antiporter [Bacteroidales bacterium]